MEVLDIMFKKARHLSQVGDWDTANIAFDEIIKKDKVSTGHSLAYSFSYLLTYSLTYSGKKIEAKLEQIRIFLFNDDIPKIKENIAAAKVLIDKGGDWDKRNRLKVFTH
jgi:26S proteasome regulatory subunit N7